MQSTAKVGQSTPKAFFAQKPLQLPVVQNVSCVFPQTSRLGGLYIGNFMGAQNVDLLKERGIRAVLTTSVETRKEIVKAAIVYAPEHIPFHKRIQAHDRLNFSILDHFEDCLEFIEKCRRITNVFVHCYAGVSRSASIVLAYIMKSNKWTFDTALNFLKHKRLVVNPNQGFATQLKQYERRLTLSSRATSTNSNSTTKPKTPTPARRQPLPPTPHSSHTPITTKPPLPRLNPAASCKPDLTKKPTQQPPRSMSTEGSHNFQLQFKHIPSRATNGPSLLSGSNVGKLVELQTPLQTPVERKEGLMQQVGKRDVKDMKEQVIKTPTKTMSSMSTPQKESPEDDDRAHSNNTSSKKFVRPRDLPGYRLN